MAAADLGGRGAGGLGRLLAQQLVDGGERVLDVEPKPGARVRLLATGAVNKTDPERRPLGGGRGAALAVPPLRLR